ncbi:MAG: T9SS type A sorting domain-containing protein [bacterium]|nr:T9SS type A sorting domain-containing protein [bacterium]
MKKTLIVLAALFICAIVSLAQPIPMQNEFMLGIWGPGPGENPNDPFSDFVSRHYNHVQTGLTSANLGYANTANIKLSGWDPEGWTVYGSNHYWAIEYLSMKTTVDIDYAATDGYSTERFTYQPFTNENCIGSDGYDQPPIAGAAYRHVTSNMGTGLMIAGLRAGYSRVFWKYKDEIPPQKSFYLRIHGRLTGENEQNVDVIKIQITWQDQYSATHYADWYPYTPPDVTYRTWKRDDFTPDEWVITEPVEFRVYGSAGDPFWVADVQVTWLAPEDLTLDIFSINICDAYGDTLAFSPTNQYQDSVDQAVQQYANYPALGTPPVSDIAELHWNVAEMAELFGIDAFPDDATKDHYLLKYCTTCWIDTSAYARKYIPSFAEVANLMNDSDPILHADHPPSNHVHVDGYATHNISSDPTVYRYRYHDFRSSVSKYIHFMKTEWDINANPAELYVNAIQDGWDFTGLKLTYPSLTGAYKTTCYTPSGSSFQKPVGHDGLTCVNFAQGEMGPGALIMVEDGIQTDVDGYDQSLPLHSGWNLVSWGIWPSGTPNVNLTIATMLPSNGWIGSNPGGQVYTYQYGQQYWPPMTFIGDQDWKPDWAYYFRMGGPVNWQLTDKPHNDHHTIDIEPSDAWSRDPLIGEEMLVRWFFLGYTTQGYMKLASIPSGSYPCNGDPANFSYEGPLHWLIWWDSSDPNNPPNYPLRDLKIVKTDEGRVYIPMHQAIGGGWEFIDQIGVLEPGKGYFLGFYCQEGALHEFEGWPDNPTWQNNSIEPKPNPQQSQVASAAHFQFNPFTHWSYPVMIDTVDLQETPLAVGDEIGVFDGSLCVGSVSVDGKFPVIVTCWEDDIATPDTLDGYTANNEMTFVWYDASQNLEAEFQLPPMIEAADDSIAPNHSGFGAGLWARRTFMEGVQSVMILPAQFKLQQNYPNPFNAQTVIPLELPQRSHLIVEIFNLQGQKVKVIFDGIENAGYPKIHWDGEKLSSGVYLCRARAQGLEREGTYTAVSKLVLMK